MSLLDFRLFAEAAVDLCRLASTVCTFHRSRFLSGTKKKECYSVFCDRSEPKSCVRAQLFGQEIYLLLLRCVHATDPAIAKVFAEIHRTNPISLIVRTSWRVQGVESYALSKFQPSATLGDFEKRKKTIREKLEFF